MNSNHDPVQEPPHTSITSPHTVPSPSYPLNMDPILSCHTTRLAGNNFKKWEMVRPSKQCIR